MTPVRKYPTLSRLIRIVQDMPEYELLRLIRQLEEKKEPAGSSETITKHIARLTEAHFELLSLSEETENFDKATTLHDVAMEVENLYHQLEELTL